MSGPFANLVVVDTATLGAAPQIATFFGDLGARVIKVEHPRGDPLRQLVDANGATLQWKLVNRNKECVTLDATVPDGRPLLERLLERADVVVSSLPAQRLADFALDAPALRTRHPRLVAVNLTTYGTTGPWRDRPGSGTLAEAVSGLAHLTGPADGPPTLAPVGLGDWLGVLHGIIAALTGLASRDGGARTFDVAMTEPLLGLLGQRIAQTARSGADPGRHGNRFPTMAPRNTYRAADGRWVAITAGTNDLVARLFTVIGRPGLVSDERFRTNRARLANVEALDAAIGGWIAGRSRRRGGRSQARGCRRPSSTAFTASSPTRTSGRAEISSRSTIPSSARSRRGAVRRRPHGGSRLLGRRSAPTTTPSTAGGSGSTRTTSARSAPRRRLIVGVAPYSGPSTAPAPRWCRHADEIVIAV
jgi:crotonobetainyl-CoA:carnitine CoA-transferase CaiB-like acyl-CoA transferase